MKRFSLLIVIFLLMIGCSVSNNKEEEPKNTAKETSVSEQGEAEDKSESSDDDLDPEEEKDKETGTENVFNDMDMTIPKLDIGSQFGEDDNMKYEHTEKEIVEEHMDENGRIYFGLDDYPIRKITSEEGNISNITNYSDTYINMLEGVSYTLPEDGRLYAYDFFISNPPEDLRHKQRDEYRSWEEATNLERGIMQIVLLSVDPLNDLGNLIDQDIYADELFDTIQNEFLDLGNPNVLIPAPQTVLDMQLFENMQMIQGLWGELGKFEQPEKNKAEFAALYQALRQEMNNIVIRVNYTLSEDIEG